MKCNAKYVAAYFLYLQRLHKDGYLEGFGEDGLEHLTEKSLEYFKRIGDNFEKYNALDEKNETSRPFNVISKHFFTYIDYDEEIGRRAIDTETYTENAELYSQLDIMADGEDYERSIEEAGAGLIAINERFLGAKLNLDDRFLIVPKFGDSPVENQKDALFQDLLVAFEGHASIEQTETIESAYDEAISALLQELETQAPDNYESAVSSLSYALSTSFDSSSIRPFLRIVQSLVHNDNDAMNSINTSSYGRIANLPFKIGKDEMKGHFYDKEALVDELSEISKNAYVQKIQKTLALSLGGDENGEKKAKEILEAVDTKLNTLFRLYASDSVDAYMSNIEKNMYSFLETFQSGLREVKDRFRYYFSRGSDSHNSALMDEAEMNKEVIVSVDLVGIGEEIKSLPYIKKDTVKYTTFKFNTEKLADDLVTLDSEVVFPNNITMTFDTKRKKSIVDVHDFKSADGHIIDIPKAYNKNDYGNGYLIDKRYAKDNPSFKVMAIDESDQRANGKFATIYRNVVRGADNSIAATGTLIAGMAKDAVSQLALSGNMHTNDVASNESEFTKQCGIFQIKSVVVAKASFAIGNPMFAEKLKSFYAAYKTASLDKKSGINIQSLLTDGIERSVIKEMISLGLASESDFADVEINKEVHSFKSLFETMMKDEQDSSGASLDFVTRVNNAIFSSHTLTKLRPGINNPKTFVSLINSIGDQTLSIMARETLSGKKETVRVLDYDEYLGNFPRKGNGNFTKDKFLENNKAGVRLVQAAVSMYANKNFLYHVQGFLVDNFKGFTKLFDYKKGRNKLLKTLAGHINSKLGTDYTDGLLATVMNKTTSVGDDDFVSVYKSYILSNGDLSVSRHGKIGEDRKKVFFEMLELYDSFLKDCVVDIANSKTAKMYIGNTEVDVSHANVSYQQMFKSVKETLDTQDVIDSVSLGYPEGMVFSIAIDLCPPEYQYIFREPDKSTGMYIPYTFELTNKHENRIFDFVGSLGLIDQCKSKINDDKSFVFSSARTHGAIHNLLVAIDAVYKRNDANGRPVDIIFNVPSGKGKTAQDADYASISRRFNENIIESNGLKIYEVPRTMLERTMQQSVKNDNQIVVVTNFEAASRGLSFADLDEILATGAMDKGKEFVQFFARLFSVSRQDAVVSMFHGGADASISPNNEKGAEALINIFSGNKDFIQQSVNELLQAPSTTKEDNERIIDEVMPSDDSFGFKPTETSNISEFAMDKQNVFKGFMLGQNTSINSAIIPKEEKRKSKKAFEPSKGYASKIGIESPEGQNSKPRR